MARKHPGVESLGSGKYRIRTSMYHPKTGRRAEIDRIVKASDATAAATLLANARADWLAQRARSKPGERRRLGDAITAWFAEKKRSVKASTAATYETAVKWWSKVLGDYWLDAIEPHEVADALDGAHEGGFGSETLDGRLRVLRTFATEEGVPAMVHGVSVKRDVRDEERMEDEGRGFDLDELRAFLEHGPRAWLRKDGEVNDAWRRSWTLLHLMAWTGMRFSEASALEWPDLNLDAGTVRIRRRQVRGIVDHVKAKSSKRVVVLPEDVVAMLREHRAAMLRRQQRGVSSALVFPSRRAKGSGYVTNGHARKAMLRVCRGAEIGHRVEDGAKRGGWSLDGRPAVHVLRHTFNNLLRQNAAELIRQSLIGHADEVSGKRYSRVGLDEKRAAVGAVVAMVRGKPE